jgi:hypothetical protein
VTSIRRSARRGTMPTPNMRLESPCQPSRMRALKAVDGNLICHGRWSGLSGRTLTAGNSRRILTGIYRAEQDTYDVTQGMALDALPHALPEVVHSMLAPLYELFEFFKLPKRLVEEELASLQKTTF